LSRVTKLTQLRQDVPTTAHNFHNEMISCAASVEPQPVAKCWILEDFNKFVVVERKIKFTLRSSVPFKLFITAILIAACHSKLIFQPNSKTKTRQTFSHHSTVERLGYCFN
jgi:hypothetical protein